jgi:hypothetical protein
MATRIGDPLPAPKPGAAREAGARAAKAIEVAKLREADAIRRKKLRDDAAGLAEHKRETREG